MTHLIKCLDCGYEALAEYKDFCRKCHGKLEVITEAYPINDKHF